MRIAVLPLLALLWGAGAASFAEPPAISTPSPPHVTKIVIKNEVLHRIDSRIFGQFLERTDGGERGPEAAWLPEKNQFRPGVIELLRQWQIPLLRFPGGTVVEHGGQWTRLIDDAYDRETAERPRWTAADGVEVTNHFGFDEFFRVAGELGAEPLITVSITDSLRGLRTLEESAQCAAALVAYCNAPLESDLPEELARWARLRARHGHPAPHAVRLWQIGNEAFLAVVDPLKKQGLAPAEIAERYVVLLEAHIAAMRAVDPSIQTIVDVQMETLPADEQQGTAGSGVPVTGLIKERLGDKVSFFSHHTYYPWAIKVVEKDGEPRPPDEVTMRDFWLAAVSAPQIDPETGLSRYDNQALRSARRLGYPLAVTEWNWNGWWGVRTAAGDRPPSSLFAQGVGAAGMLHGLLRAGDTVKIATQSMLMGTLWDIGAIALDPSGKTPPHPRPTGEILGLYSRHHGGEMIACEIAGARGFRQPWRLESIPAAEHVAYLDPVITRRGRTIYAHIINRNFDEDIAVELDCAALGAPLRTARHIVYSGRLRDEPAPGEPVAPGQATERVVEAGGESLALTLPRRTVSIVIMELAPEARSGDPVR